MLQASKQKDIRGDLSITNNLQQYRSWDIETASPIQALAETAFFVSPSQVPLPEISDLLNLVKLKLIEGAIEGTMIESLNDVRQFARLLLTTENLSLMIAGLVALDYERSAYRYYVDERGLIASLWSPVDRNITRRAHRALLGGRAYLHAWTKPELLEANFLGASLPPGFCAIANEAFPIEYSLRPALASQWPLERDFRPEYATLDRIFERAKKSCRLRYLKALSERGQFAREIPGPAVLNRLPYWRRIFALKASLANVTGLDAYADGRAPGAPVPLSPSRTVDTATEPTAETAQ
jgi:hypothetical protein